MPTTLPRHAITETAEIAEILGRAAKRWPDTPPSKLIKLVLHDWDDGHRESRKRRAEAMSSLIGSLPGATGIYDRNEDWPE